MKIAMVCLSSGEASVQPRRVIDLSKALIRQGHQVTMYTGRAGIDSVQPPVDDMRIIAGPAAPHDAHADPEMLNDLGAFTQFLENHWERDTPDVVHAHYWSAGLATQLAARARRIPVVQTFHSLGHAGHRAPAHAGSQTRRRLESLVARGSSWLIASHSEEMVLLSQMGGRRSRTTLVPCGVDSELFTPLGSAAPRSDNPRIVSVGDVTVGRGYDVLIRSLRWIPAGELLIVGAKTDDAEATRLISLATAEGVSERVGLYGRVPHGEMPALLRSADVVACLPEHEAFGVTALEAMACGVPVVASSVGGFVDTVVPDVTGRLVSAHKPRDCAEIILPILKHPFVRNSLGSAGRDRARSRYSWERIATDTIRVYERLVPQVSEHPAELAPFRDVSSG